MDLKVQMVKSLKAPFGGQNMSKAASPHHYDGTKATCWLILRSWMLGRVGLAKNGWMDARVARQRWWLAEFEKLQDDLDKRGGGTGNDKADDKIIEFLPTIVLRRG